METLHAEGDSPFVADNNDTALANAVAVADEDVQYTECPVDGCGEILELDEMDFHLELHAEEAGAHVDNDSDLVANQATYPSQPARPVAAPSSSGPSRSHREGERERRRHAEVSGKQAKVISTWKRLLRMPNSSASSTLSSRHSKDPTMTAPPDSGNGKRLGVSPPNTPSLLPQPCFQT